MTVSVIIPALNEGKRIFTAVTRALSAPAVEVLVVDGGSGDDTVGEAGRAGARLLQAAPGRARQMNAGGREAAGEVLLFLHADTLLPDGFPEKVLKAVNTPGCIAGAFSLHIAMEGLAPRLIERGANWRARRWGMPYGDQGIFLRKEVFRQAGGFPEQPFMEDFELMRRLRRLGRIRILPETVETSGRRWQRVGPWRLTLVHQCLVAGYLLGVSPFRLGRWYRAATR